MWELFELLIFSALPGTLWAWLLVWHLAMSVRSGLALFVMSGLAWGKFEALELEKTVLRPAWLLNQILTQGFSQKSTLQTAILSIPTRLEKQKVALSFFE